MTAGLLVAVLCGAGCASEEPAPAAPTSQSPAPGAGTSTARALVDALARDGQPVLDPVDTTAVDCKDAGCAQAITTDRFRVLSFPSTGAAQRYAADHGMRQIGILAVDFSPAVPDTERDEIWTEITRLVR